jgi:predicted ribosome quality control (RQC) complex YloA/Tae2 family protein
VAAESGSHVVVRNPEGLDRLPKATEQLAAGLAAGYSKARKGGRVSVHMCRAEDVRKPRGLPPGKVVLERFTSIQIAPWRPDRDGDAP